MNRHDEALEVMLILRRRLLDRMAGVIVANRESLLNGKSRTNDPLSSNADLAEIIRNLADIDRAIAGLADLSLGTPTYELPAPENGANGSNQFGVFTKFVELVRQTRLEEASQELSRTLQMPLDRVITATRFFTRSLKTDPSIPAQLSQLEATIGEISPADAMRTVMRLFGFQAVESRMAIQSLLARNRAAAVVR